MTASTYDEPLGRLGPQVSSGQQLNVAGWHFLEFEVRHARDELARQHDRRDCEDAKRQQEPVERRWMA
jgi:hypothetical protein